MPLESGSQLGGYQIRAPLGAGGMGDVYRARDPRLDREVALKVLAAELADRVDWRKRFEREARLVAALNHPNIAAIYGLEEADGLHFLVLELVEGQTLQERLLRGPASLDEALRTAGQIAEGLEAAHEKGVVHRDLKPANIKVTSGGRVKVLDFGIAKALGDGAQGADTKTLTLAADEGTTTRGDRILGTPCYMSPEQASGERVDTRTDVWSFGVVLWELLAGTRPFEGTTTARVLAAILRDDPDWDLLPKETPEAVRLLLRRCLTRERRDRLQAIGDARVLIQDCLSNPGSPPVTRGPARRTRWLLPGTAASILAGVGLVWLALRAGAPPPTPRLSRPIQISAATGVEDYPSWSPDGRTLAYEADETGRWDVWVADVGGRAAANRTVDDPADHRFPSWSPDGSRIAFLSMRGEESGYYVMPALGGPPRRVITVPWRAAGGFLGFYRSPPSWSADGRELAGIVYDTEGDKMEAFIEIADVITLETRRLPLPTGADSRRDLDWSRDGRFFAFTACPAGEPETSRLWLVRASDGEGRPLTDGRTWVKSPKWASDARYLDYVSNRDGTSDLWRQRMDASGRPVGDPVPITRALQVRQACFSPDGSRLAFSRGRWVSNVWRVPILDDRAATWQDAEQVTFDEAFIEFVDVSPDGRRLAFSSDRSGNQDLWTMTLDGGRDLVHLTSDPAPEWAPRWSPDGTRLAFYSLRSGTRQVWVMPAEGGAAERVTRGEGAQNVAPRWSPDGTELAYWSDRTGSPEIWVSSLDGAPDRQLTDGPSDNYASGWSPDGRWLTFYSDRDGRQRIWRVPASGGDPEPLSQRAAGPTVWSPNGRRLHFLSVGSSGGDAGDLWTLSLEDGKERPSTALVGRRGRLGGAGIATDGRFLYFTWRTDHSDVWVMDVASD